MRLASFRPVVVLCLLLLALGACTNGQNTTNGPSGPPLYDRLGGKTALAGVVDDFFATVGSDPRIAARFAGLGDARFKAALVDELCATTGGPCHYTGPSMKDAHANLGISDAEFNAMVQDLRKSMGRQGMSVDDQVAFAAALEPLRDDIVSPLLPTSSVVRVPAGRPPSGHAGPIHRASGHGHTTGKATSVKKPAAGPAKPKPKHTHTTRP
jgi:hemoglobin